MSLFIDFIVLMLIIPMAMYRLHDYLDDSSCRHRDKVLIAALIVIALPYCIVTVLFL